MKTLGIQTLLIGGLSLFIFACDAPKSTGNESETSETREDSAESSASESLQDFEIDDFYAEELDDLEFPEFGKSRLVVGGETFEAKLWQCILEEKDQDPFSVLSGDKYRVSLRSRFEVDGIRHGIRVTQNRLRDPADFAGSGAFDFERAALTLYAESGEATSLRSAESTVMAIRAEPGSEVWNVYGEADSPLLKVQFDGEVLRATSTGSMRGMVDTGRHISLPSGAYTFAAFCEPEVTR